MIDANNSLHDIVSNNPKAFDVLMNYGIPCYNNVENQLSSLNDIAIRYSLDLETVMKEIDSKSGNNLY